MSEIRTVSSRRRRAGLALAAVIAGALMLAFIPGTPAQKAKLDLSGYRLTFDENFSSLDISAYGPNTRWIAHTPWNGDFGDAVFDNPGPKGPFSIGPNGLTITAREDANGKWHSGLLCSKSASGAGPRGFAQQYGYFEMRAKLPADRGVWPAFWLVSASGKPPAPELDVIEFYGGFPSNYRSTEHVWRDNRDDLGLGHLVTVPKGILASQFNDFGILIEPDTTTFYFNRIAYWSTPTLPAFRQPMSVIVDLALGGGWPIDKLTSPQVMQVQYIRAYGKR